MDELAAGGGFTRRELALLLDAVMVLYRAMEAVTENDESELPAIAAIQRKVEALLAASDALEPGLADAIHEALCGKKANGVSCVAYRRGSGSHWSFYQERARAVYARLEPQIGSANVTLAVCVVLDELL